MKDEEIIEYYPNGRIKHKICYYDNGCKYSDIFYDEDGYIHRNNNLPAYQEWNTDGVLRRKTYSCHGNFHNIYNPADVWFFQHNKIWWKSYWIEDNLLTKLKWVNIIKII